MGTAPPPPWADADDHVVARTAVMIGAPMSATRITRRRDDEQNRRRDQRNSHHAGVFDREQTFSIAARPM
jgi:hypothetical protein